MKIFVRRSSQPPQGRCQDETLTAVALCGFASFSHADEQNGIQSQQGIEICQEPPSDNCKALGDKINQWTPEKQKAFDVADSLERIEPAEQLAGELSYHFGSPASCTS